MNELKGVGTEIEVNQVYNNISKLIVNTKNKVQQNLNSEMVILYWKVGKTIREEVLKESRAEYGSEVITNLSIQLKEEYGRGYSRRNLFNMVKLYDTYTDFEIVQTLSAQLSWSHFIELLRLDEPLKTEFYITMT